VSCSARWTCERGESRGWRGWWAPTEWRGAARRRDGPERGLLTVFGKVEVTRLAYRRRGHARLHPADVNLNLPVELDLVCG